MTTLTPGTGDPGVVWTDDTHDRIRGGHDQQSRYGAYLRRHRDLFAAHEEGVYDSDEIHEGIIASPVWFAVAAWRVATGPIMSPPYVQTHPRVINATLTGAQDVAGAVAIVTLAAPIPERVRSVSHRWSGWLRGAITGEYRVPEEDQATMLGTLELRIPIPADTLPRPHRRVIDGVPDVADAKDAVRVVDRVICRYANPVLEALEGLR